MKGTLVKADKGPFAVFQTIYSGADTNMNFDWKKRLDDTKWTDECYWVMQGDARIGGILVLDDCTRFPFLIEPYCDRTVFWRIVIQFLAQNRPDITKLYSVLDVDIPILLSFGYKIDQSRRMMCRPTESFELQLDDQFTSHIPNLPNDQEEMAVAIVGGYTGGIDYLLDPDSSEQDNLKDVRNDLKKYHEDYTATNTMHHSIVLREKQTNKIAAICMAGQRPNRSHSPFSGISDITVLPEYRGKGLAKYMIQHALTNAAPTCEAMLLCVTTGNNAEGLYRDMGFWGGPRFTSMSKLV